MMNQDFFLEKKNMVQIKAVNYPAANCGASNSLKNSPPPCTRRKRLRCAMGED